MMRKCVVGAILLFMILVSGNVSDHGYVVRRMVALTSHNNDFISGGFVMCGVALAATKTVDPNDPRILSLEKELLNNQKKAPIIKKVERDMTVDETYKTTFGVDITKRRLADIINDWISIYGNFSTSIINNYSEVMEAKLTGEGFQITPQSELIQKFPDDKKISWDFLVTPKKSGPLKLHLEIYAIEDSKYDSSKKVRTHKHEEDIYVSSTVHSMVKEKVGPESTVGMLFPLKEVAGGVLVALIIGWLTSKGHSRKKK